MFKYNLLMLSNQLFEMTLQCPQHFAITMVPNIKRNKLTMFKLI